MSRPSVEMSGWDEPPRWQVRGPRRTRVLVWRARLRVVCGCGADLLRVEDAKPARLRQRARENNYRMECLACLAQVRLRESPEGVEAVEITGVEFHAELTERLVDTKHCTDAAGVGRHVTDWRERREATSHPPANLGRRPT